MRSGSQDCVGWKEIDLKILTRGNWMEGGAFHWVLREKLSWDREQVVLSSL